MKSGAAWWLTVMLCAGVAGAQEAPTEEPEAEPAEIEEVAPEDVELPASDSSPRTAVAGGESTESGSGNAKRPGALSGIRAISVERGVARVLLKGERRTLRPGDWVGSDVVRRVEPGRIVLARMDDEGTEEEATVIVDFDAIGRSRIRVLHRDNPMKTPER